MQRYKTSIGKIKESESKQKYLKLSSFQKEGSLNNTS